MFRSATLRVTLITVAITMTISVLFSGAIYHFTSQDLQTAEQRQYVRLRRVYTPKPFPRSLLGQEQDEASRHLLLNLIYLNLIILAVSTGIGALLAHAALEPIERAMELQGRFAADASHELRTPLAAMRSEIEVALRDKRMTMKDAQTVLVSNLEEITQLEGLAGGLLQLARLESQSEHFRPVNLKTAITSAIDGLKPMAKARRIKLNYSVADLKVVGNQDSLKQLLTILLDNAIKYGRTGGQVTITTRASNHKAVVMVSDDGPGIAPADLPHVFERFWRANTSRTKSQAEGYGLGLPIAREIVHLHHGEIRAHSSEGKGTAFTVELPQA